MAVTGLTAWFDGGGGGPRSFDRGALRSLLLAPVPLPRLFQPLLTQPAHPLPVLTQDLFSREKGELPRAGLVVGCRGIPHV